jgi:hypothetical protein
MSSSTVEAMRAGNARATAGNIVIIAREASGIYGHDSGSVLGRKITKRQVVDRSPAAIGAARLAFSAPG